MFYAHFVLSKKGPLAKIWLAAHWDKKLTKAHIFETDIEDSVDAIIQPKVKLALRTSGHLLLGVVRIYSRKAKYLLADCNEALVKIKMAFRPGTVDLPEENREAAVAAITLAENFYDFENVMVDMADFELPSQYNFNQCRPEEITIREEFGERSFIGDDGFGEIGFDSFVMPDIRLDDPLYVASVRPPPDSEVGSPDASGEMDAVPEEMPMEVDNDEDVIQPNVDQVEVTESDFHPPANEPVADDLSDYEGPAGIEDDDSDQEGFGTRLDTNVFDENMVDKSDRLFEEPESVVEPLPAPAADTNIHPSEPDADVYEHREQDVPCATEQTTLVGVDQTTLITNEAEAFALMPIDVTSVGTERKAKKKRKLIVDEQKAISSEAMKVQLAHGTDLVTPLDLAPPTKKLMQWKESGGVERLLVLPGRPLLQKGLSQLYTSNLVTHASDEEEVVERVKETRKRKDAEEDVEGVRRNKRSNGIAKRGNDTSVPESSLLADNSTVEEPRQEDASSHEVLDRTSRISFADSLQISNIPADDTLTNALSPAQLDEPQIPVFPDGPQTPRPDLVLPELPPCPQLPSFADESRSTVQLESSLVEENLKTPRHYDEPLSVSIMEPRSIMSEWAGGDDDLDDSIFNENVHANIGNNETARFLDDEQEEDERISNKRSSQMLQMLHRIFQTRDYVGMRELLARNNRKQVASKFYTFLVLKKLNAVDVCQKESYGDIIITKGPAFDSVQ